MVIFRVFATPNPGLPRVLLAFRNILILMEKILNG
jgi:hypothetical protein